MQCINEDIRPNKRAQRILVGPSWISSILWSLMNFTLLASKAARSNLNTINESHQEPLKNRKPFKSRVAAAFLSWSLGIAAMKILQWIIREHYPTMGVLNEITRAKSLQPLSYIKLLWTFPLREWLEAETLWFSLKKTENSFLPMPTQMKIIQAWKENLTYTRTLQDHRQYQTFKHWSHRTIRSRAKTNPRRKKWCFWRTSIRLRSSLVLKSVLRSILNSNSRLSKEFHSILDILKQRFKTKMYLSKSKLRCQ